MEEVHAFHADSAQDVLRFFGTSHNGLSADVVLAHRRVHGYNVVAEPKRPGVTAIFTKQFLSPLMMVLVAAFTASVILGDALDTVLIAAVMLVHAVLGFLQEYRADRAFERLAAYLPRQAKVRREGKIVIVNAADVVVGDILLLAAGDNVVADARILNATQCEASEAALTGEAAPVAKSAAMLPRDTSPAERANMLYAGTVIASGKAEAIVVAVGQASAFGRIAQLSSEVVEHETPLQRQLKTFSRNLVVGLLLACVLVFAFGLAKGIAVGEMFTLAVALAVAAVPEGLLVTLTVILALGMQRMLARQALVRNLVAAETLGGVSVMCADKTGTMTQGTMEVSELHGQTGLVAAESSEATPLLLALALGITAEVGKDGERTHITGSPTESSILRFLLSTMASLPLGEYRLIDEIPFSSTRKFSARRYAHGQEEYLVALGGADVLLPRVDCTDIERGMFAAAIERMAERGLRVIMVAENRGAFAAPFGNDAVADLHMVGFIGLDDPLRPHVRQTVAEAARAGIRTIMLTGDHPSTARAVARAIGLPSNEGAVMTGVELARLPDTVLQARIKAISVFARIMPEDKLRIVRALQALGHTVAMTGDGVNDAPALRAADVGVAVGSGTDVAKESADIVLLDNDVATIVAAVREGRGLFDNIRKVVAYLLTSSMTEIVLILGALMMDLPTPLLPFHILWINVLADGLPSIALAAEPPEQGAMREPPRPRFAGVVRRDMATVMTISSVLTAVTLLVMLSQLAHAGVNHAMIYSFMFVSLGLTSTIVIFSMRSFRRTIFAISPFSNPWLLLAVASSMALLFLPFFVPGLAPLLGMAPLPPLAIPFLLLLSVVQIMAIEAGKMLFIVPRRS